jgi:sugar lactone lactonase YvrE
VRAGILPDVITEYVVPGDAVFPEGITEDPDGVTFYVSSEHDGTIFRGRTDTPRLEPWQQAGADGRTQALGLAVDGAGRLLVCGGSTGHLFAYGTRTGELAARRTVPSHPALLNDVCVTGGHAYVTDSQRPVIWRFPVSGDIGEPEEWLDLTEHGAAPGELHYLNGIVAAHDGATLLVAAQGTGVLWRADVAARTASPVDLGGERVNGDGLAFAGGLLYACDNTDEPDGSVRYWLTALRLSADARAATLAGRWERPLADTPTTLAYLDGRLYLVNSQFGARRRGTAAPPFTVSALARPA